jgi:PAT family beta-lactamase induction signal transducer AmpG
MGPFGCYMGFMTTALPLLLSAGHISVDRIATISAVVLSPTFWAFLMSPVLDVRFHRRFYSIAFTLLAAVCLAGAVLTIHHLFVFEVLLTLGTISIVMFAGALTGWMPDLVNEEQQSWLGAWMNVANIGAAGAFGTLAIMLMRHTPAPIAAVLLGAIVAAPLLLLFWFPQPTKPYRTAAETFRNLFRDVYKLSKKRACLLGMIALISPCGCFALTNLFSGLGADYHTPEAWVAWVGGVGIAIACSAGCLAGAPLCRRFPRRTIYLLLGMTGALVCAVAYFAPKNEFWFTAVILAYNFFQGMNYTAFSSLQLQIVGANNPLAATQMSLLASLANGSMSYMTWLDGRGYQAGGIRGLLATDGLLAAVFCLILLWFFHRIESRRLEPALQN